MQVSILDALLLRRFPGRTLEELDGMNWPRLLRAFEAERIENIEERHKQYLSKQRKELSDSDWEAIQQHNELLDEFYGEP